MHARANGAEASRQHKWIKAPACSLAFRSVASSKDTSQQARSGWSISRYSIAGALLGLIVVCAAVLIITGQGGSATSGQTNSAHDRALAPKHSGSTDNAPSVPLASKGLPHTRTKKQTATTAETPIVGPEGEAAAQVRDPEEADSFPVAASIHHARAKSPSSAGEAAVAPGALSEAQVRKELKEEEQAQAQEQAQQKHALIPEKGGFSVGGDGTIPIPGNIPEAVQRVIAGGNAIADFPYIWGGGHASFIAKGYDCSGSVSYALAAAGLLDAPLVSGELAHWGAPGPGKWITIYANAGHTFMDVDGVWFDTAGRSGPYSSRWLVSEPSLTGYAVRHPPGL